MARLPRLTAFQIIRVIGKRGFVLTRTHGSHQVFHNPSTGRRVTIPFHRGQTIPPGTLLNILGEAGIDREELDALVE